MQANNLYQKAPTGLISGSKAMKPEAKSLQSPSEVEKLHALRMYSTGNN